MDMGADERRSALLRTGENKQTTYRKNRYSKCAVQIDKHLDPKVHIILYFLTVLSILVTFLFSKPPTVSATFILLDCQFNYVLIMFIIFLHLRLPYKTVYVKLS